MFTIFLNFMLAPKRLSKRKAITYFIIVFTMAIGIIFFIYQNHQLTTIKPSQIAETIPVIDQTATTTEINNRDNQEKPSAIDTAILESPKYQALKNNSVLLINNKEKTGKKNPFEPWK